MNDATKRALAILQAAIDREQARRIDRYGRGYNQKPAGHDELNARLDKELEELLKKESK